MGVGVLAMVRSSSLGYSNRGARDDDVGDADADVEELRVTACSCKCTAVVTAAAPVIETQRSEPSGRCKRLEKRAPSVLAPARRRADERQPRCRDSERATFLSLSAKTATALLLTFLMMCRAFSWWRTAKHTSTVHESEGKRMAAELGEEARIVDN